MGAAKPEDRPLVLVTGMSGAGKSTALNVLEDLGYEAVDNLPLSLLSSLVEAHGRNGVGSPLALCIDSRTRGFDTAHFERYLGPLLSDRGPDITLLFLDCDTEVLGRRYSETRRRHPLAGDRPVRDGIRRERALLGWPRDRADITIDSSTLSINDFRRIMDAHFRRQTDRALAISVMSFAYRRGLPREADLVFDVRFLANPYYVPALRPLTGHDPAVVGHVQADPAYGAFFESLAALIDPLLPAFEREGKSYLTIAIGCTGGRHRSVVVAEHLALSLGGDERMISVRHRDLETSDTAPSAADRAGR